MMRKAEEAGVSPEDATKEENFPIERARLRRMPVYLALFAVATIGYGWCMQGNINLAGPLILQIISKYKSNAMRNIRFAEQLSSWIYVYFHYEYNSDTYNRSRPFSRLGHHSMCMLFLARLFSYFNVNGYISAQNNLIRCLLGAGLVALIDIITNALQPGWTYTLLGCIAGLMCPLIYLAMWLGPRCRAKRRPNTLAK